MSETRFRQYIRDGLSKYGHIVQIENAILPGHPDTNYCIHNEAMSMMRRCGRTQSTGDIELKYLKEWPKRADTIVKIDHYTQEQRMWMFKRAMALGDVFLFVKIKDEYFLFSAFAAFELVGKKLSRDGFYCRNRIRWEKKINFEELRDFLILWKNYQQDEKELLKKYASLAVPFT